MIMSDRKCGVTSAEIFNAADKISDCSFCAINERIKIRRMILKMIVNSIRRYKENPNILEELEVSAEI